MDETVNHGATDGVHSLLRRRFLKGVGGALLAVCAGVLLTGCPSTSQSSNTNVEQGDWDQPEHDHENPPENPDGNPGQPGEPGGDGGGGEPGGGEGGGGEGGGGP